MPLGKGTILFIIQLVPSAKMQEKFMNIADFPPRSIEVNLCISKLSVVDLREVLKWVI